MTNQNTEKTHSDNQPESVEEDYGLKKLSIYTLFISISCLLIAGAWYKKDEIPFAAIFETTVEVFDRTANTMTDGYNSVRNYISDNNSNDQIEAISADTQTIENNEVVIAKNDNEIASDKVIVAELETNVKIDIIESEKLSGTEMLAEITESEKSPTQVIPDIKSTDITEIEEDRNEITSTEIAVIEKQVITESISTELTAEKTAPTEITKKTETFKVSSVNNTIPEPVTVQPTTQTVKTPIYQTTGAYTHSLNQYYVPVPVMFQNNMPRNNYRPANIRFPYINQGNIIEQQQHAFEQNMKIQQQMMQQAFRLQSAIFKDAKRRHQEMIKRAASWSIKSQNSRDKLYYTPYNQPAYIN